MLFSNLFVIFILVILLQIISISTTKFLVNLNFLGKLLLCLVDHIYWKCQKENKIKYNLLYSIIILLMFFMYRYLRNFFFLICILFYFIFPLYNVWFIDNDLLYSYLYLLFHLVSIVRKKEMWIYVLEKNISIRVKSYTSI